MKRTEMVLDVERFTGGSWRRPRASCSHCFISRHVFCNDSGSVPQVLEHQASGKVRHPSAVIVTLVLVANTLHIAQASYYPMTTTVPCFATFKASFWDCRILRDPEASRKSHTFADELDIFCAIANRLWQEALK